MPVPRNQFSCVTFDGKIYAIGGQFHHDSEQLDQARVDVYDPASDTWTSGPPLPKGHSHAEGSTFVHDGRIYMAGGHTTAPGESKQVDPDILALVPRRGLGAGRHAADAVVVTGGGHHRRPVLRGRRLAGPQHGAGRHVGREIAMKTVGFVGWRGMVGSVLLDRMAAEGDFGGYDPVFFSTSQVGQRRSRESAVASRCGTPTTSGPWPRPTS